MKDAVTVGLDFGTLSVRALIVRVSDGEELGSASVPYAHGVMDAVLTTPSGEIPLPPNWALESPRDYLDALSAVIPAALDDAGVSPDQVIGAGVDFTTCTLLPVRADGTPLCFEPEFENEPHAWVKLWKHHGAQRYADRINALAAERGEEWLARYGGVVSSEWMFPKILETLEEAPAVYREAASFLDAGLAADGQADPELLHRGVQGPLVRLLSLGGILPCPGSAAGARGFGKAPGTGAACGDKGR